MPTSRAERSAGFTLIELMVVILLIGLALGVSLTLDFSNSPQRLEQQARQVAGFSELLAQEAVLSGSILGLDLFTVAQDGEEITGIRWLRQEQDDWISVDIGEAGEQKEMLFAADVEVLLEIGSHAVVPEERRDLDSESLATGHFSPEVLFLPSREITPFILTLNGEDGIASKVSADIMGRVRVNDDAPTSP